MLLAFLAWLLVRFGVLCTCTSFCDDFHTLCFVSFIFLHLDRLDNLQTNDCNVRLYVANLLSFLFLFNVSVYHNNLDPMIALNK